MEAAIKAMWNQRSSKHFKLWFTVWLGIYMMGVLIYVFGCQAGWLASLYHAFKLFTFAVSPALGGKATACGSWIYILGFIAAGYTAFGLLYVIYKQYKDAWHTKQSIAKPHILVLGLGNKAAAYIDSELAHDPMQTIIAIERDPQNPHIEIYRARGVAVQIADATDPTVLTKTKLKNTQHIVALTGSNTDNLEIALNLKKLLEQEENTPLDLYIRNDDPALTQLYRNGGLLDDSPHLIIHMFSMVRNSARELFTRHSIDGEGQHYMRSGAAFGIVVTGESPLAVETVGQICELAHLPYENQVTIYCITEDAQRHQQRIEYRYPHIDQIPRIKMVYLSLEQESAAYYSDVVWSAPLSHIVLAYPEARDNIAVATELLERTYIREVDTQDLSVRLHLALYEDTQMAVQIDETEGIWRYCDSFALTYRMAGREQIIDEQGQALAKRIHAGYRERYFPDTTYGDSKQIEQKWLDMDNINNRPSNIAQANHLPLKLKAMGLRAVPSTRSQAELIIHNRKMLNAAIGEELKQLGLDDAAMVERTKRFDKWEEVPTFDYFPTTYETLVEQLIRAEHNRWNAYHYLRGWRHNPDQTHKPTKEHRCLIPMAQMDERDRFTVLYDLYAILYIPNLLASIGEELVKYE